MRYEIIKAKLFLIRIGTCTFESDECGFIQTTSDHFNWLRQRGNTPSQLTGPSIDHTSGRSNGKVKL